MRAERPDMTALDPEPLLRSRSGQVVLVIVSVAALSLATTFQLEVMMESRGGLMNFGDEFLRQGLSWGLWGVAAWPVMGLTSVLWNRSGPWPLALIVVLALTLGLSWGHARLTRVLIDALVPQAERTLPEGSSGAVFPAPTSRDVTSRREDRERTLRADRAPRVWARETRLPRSLLQCWLLLGLAAAGRGFLASRREERRAAAAELAATSAREHLAQAKLEVLQGQVHPHFLFNALHAVGGLVREGHDSLALSSLASLSELLRSSLEHGGEQLVTLADELSLVQRYIDIEAIRFADRLDWSVEGEPVAEDAVVPSLILLPLVENAVRYAVEPRVSGGRIVLHVRRDGDDVVLQLQDDGPGFSASLLGDQDSGSDDRRHFGLSSTRERLAMLYGDRATLSLGNLSEGGAQVIVRVPARGVGR